MRKRALPTLAPLTAAVCAITLATGCGSGSTATPTGGLSPAPAASSASGRPSPGVAAPTQAPLPPPAAAQAGGKFDVGAVATRYLAARENAISYHHHSARDWLAEVWPVMTPIGWQRLSASLGDSGGFPAATARQRQWLVRVTVVCRHNSDAGVATSTQARLLCAVSDRTIDATGVLVRASDLPGIWPYNGPQPPALLEMRKLDGQWLVDADETGKAG